MALCKNIVIKIKRISDEGGELMIQFEYDSIMKRYDVLVPSSLAGIESMVTVAHIDEEVESNITVYRELTITLLRQILLHWDEYLHQMSRELQEMLDDDKPTFH